VNNSLLEANSIEVPTTYDELVEASAKLRAAGVVPLALGAKDDWMDIDVFSAMSNAIAPGDQYAAMDGSGEWTTDGLIESFDAFAALFTDGVTQDGAAGATTYTDTYDLYADGKAAFFANGSWNQDMFVSAADRIGAFEASVMPMLTPAGPAPVIAGIGGLLAVNKDSDKKDAAFALASFMSSGEGQQLLIDGNLDFAVTAEDVTPSVEVSENAAVVRTQLTELLNTELAGYREVPNAAVKSALGQALLKLAAGSISGAEAAAEVQAAADEAAS
jgi:raffinose/stachyose/melibiose transport system substrate-binding protein